MIKLIININGQAIDTEILNQYIVGNSIYISEYFKGVEPFVDLTVTSPPYWDMKDYEGNEEQIGFGQNYESYLKDIKKIFEGVYSISKNTANLVLIIDTMKKDGRMIRLPDDVARVLEEIGWIHQDTVIWDKVKTLPWSRKGQLRNVFEYVLIFSKTQKYKYNMDEIRVVEDLKEWWKGYPERYNPQGKVPDNIWKFLIPTQGSWGSKQDFGDDEFKHACPFPPEMMARIIKLLTDENDVVFDPFSGTAVLHSVAKLMNRKFLAFDVNIAYKNVFENVTIPLVNDMWSDIERYYTIQSKLKIVMDICIKKMRILKYPQAMLKVLRKKHKLPFDLIITERLELEEDENLNNIIGKANYKIIINQDGYLNGDESNYNLINEDIIKIVSKAPYTKYGILREIDILTNNEITNVLNNMTYPLYLYRGSNISNYDICFNNSEELIEFINNNEHLNYFDKDICPTISNISIKEEDYKHLPAEEYKKFGYREEFTQDMLNDINLIIESEFN